MRRKHGDVLNLPPLLLLPASHVKVDRVLESLSVLVVLSTFPGPWIFFSRYGRAVEQDVDIGVGMRGEVGV